MDEATGLLRETWPQRTSLRERPWGMLSRFAAVQMWPKDGRGDHRLQGKVCADGRGGCHHRRGAEREVWRLALTRSREGCGDHCLC